MNESKIEAIVTQLLANAAGLRYGDVFLNLECLFCKFDTEGKANERFAKRFESKRGIA